MSRCISCQGSLAPLPHVQDYEYRVPWSSRLVCCEGCGLVTHDPPITEADIPSLYPRSYHAYRKGGRRLYHRLRQRWDLGRMRRLARHIPRGGRLLEVGCGNGEFLRSVSRLRPDLWLHGVDINDPQIHDIPKFSFHRGMLEHASLVPGVDFIYFNNLIEHVADPRCFLQRCHDLLCPGGMIFGNTPNHDSVDRRLFGRYWAGYHYPRHTFVFNHRNIEALIARTGMGEIEVWGSYGFWSLSLRNRFMVGHGGRARGLGHIAVTMATLPLDLLINVFMPHGAMNFRARKPRFAWQRPGASA